ncbi:MAG: RNA polymerase sigma factor [Actinobacteria bacterium]|nr:RNA polymerase sigma factor [Actinomycetota bacterium]
MAHIEAGPAAVSGGEWGAFERLYRETRDDLFAYLAYLLADATRAEDVLAQSFERAYRKRRGFDSRRGELRGWLFAIARNMALDEMRRARRESPVEGAALEMPGGLPAGGEDPLASASASASTDALALDRVLVANALRGLEARDRELVALKFFAGLGNREIARVVGRSETTVGSQLHRAIRKLREVLDD